jgi:hypothetical protein
MRHVALASYTANVNFVHLKSTLEVHPHQGVRLMLAVGAQRRESTHGKSQ